MRAHIRVRFLAKLGMTVVGVLFAWSHVSAQVIATEVGKSVWTIDEQTAKQGITLENDGGKVRLGIPAGSVAPDTTVEIATYASEFYVNLEKVHRVTPIYRIVVVPHPLLTSPIKGEETIGNSPPLVGGVRGGGMDFHMEIRHHGEDLGKKSVWVWEEQGDWREISAQSAPERNAARAKISTGTTYVAVFAHDQVLETGYASWYKYKQCHCAASPDYPKGTKLKVTNVKNGQSVVVRVNDYGPDRAIHPDRVIDLDVEAFGHLAGKRKGLVKVKVETI